MVLELSAETQAYIEDCEVCCNPIQLTFRAEDGALAAFSAEPIGQ